MKTIDQGQFQNFIRNTLAKIQPDDQYEAETKIIEIIIEYHGKTDDLILEWHNFIIGSKSYQKAGVLAVQTRMDRKSLI